ncbi:aldehyde dehydrogenase family protein [Brevibacterium sp. ZH18]|uniref:aldehyde dehydrogenase family protein n=1 Tax=Brevibacterium sp. ZH18 TaxID=2927784 RepID=UPI001F621B33|nr:aldehyde dehydrogenase family protein [Brevibacterium sp. ZH18]MCI4012227.1 aldehyde dehydrogenase family protein [Brevibacterium sp. ZH18]
MKTTKAFIDGVSATAAETYENIDPATGECIGTVMRSGKDTVDAAVEAARRAQASWSRTKTEVRADLMHAFADLILSHVEELAKLETEDTGKPLTQARTDAEVTARYFKFYGRTIEAYYGDYLPVDDGFHAFSRRQPLGVCGSIVAWNYPMQLFGRAVAPAVVTGNTIVLKPADETPRTAVRLAELATAAGFPPGVINIVPGVGAEAGQALAEHPGIDHIGFVGSNPVGRIIAVSAANNLIPSTLELGGKSPHIVFPDADLDTVAGFITKGILQNAGQTCSAGSRLIVHSSIAEELNAKLAKKFEAVSIGSGMQDKDLGPLVSLKQQNRVRTFVEEADGEIIVGGGVPQNLPVGAYFSPTIIARVDPSSKIANEEVFGPVLVTMEFDSEDEAIEIANGTDYALMAAVWTNDVSRAHRLALKVEAGQVYVNAFGAGGGVEYPFGGFKKSGHGREKGYAALDGYTATKTVIMKL